MAQGLLDFILWIIGISLLFYSVFLLTMLSSIIEPALKCGWNRNIYIKCGDNIYPELIEKGKNGHKESLSGNI